MDEQFASLNPFARVGAALAGYLAAIDPRLS